MTETSAKFRRRSKTRREMLKTLGGGALATIGAAGVSPPSTALAGAGAQGRVSAVGLPVVMDGHVHITSRVYWEGIDPWQPQATGWDYARARAAGINCVIECLGTSGYWSYNQAPKHTLRLIEAFHRVAEANEDKMGVALKAADARRIISSGRMAVFLGVEAGWDHDGDTDVLRALYRLGLRHIQFASQSPFNALADVDSGTDKHWNGLSARGRSMIKEANQLGILIDIVHASQEAQAAIIAASEAPVVDSHDPLKTVTGGGRGLSDDLLKAMAAKGGMIGIHGGAAAVSKRYANWTLNNVPRPSPNVVPTRPAGDYGEWATRMDDEARLRYKAEFAPWKDDPEAEALVPTVDDWAEHVAHVIKMVGADYVGIGLDMVGSRSFVLKDPTDYPDLFAAINRITTPDNARKIIGANWMRVIEKVMG